MRASEHTPRGLRRLLERLHALAEIVERGAVILVEHPAVSKPHYERGLITLAENAPRYWHRFEKQ